MSCGAHKCDLSGEKSWRRGNYWVCLKCGLPRLMAVNPPSYAQRVEQAREIEALRSKLHQKIFIRMLWEGEAFELTKEERNMAEEIQRSLEEGYWEGIPKEGYVEKPQVKVSAVGKENGIEVEFECDEPRGATSKKGDFFYIFDLLHENEQKVFFTGAKTLLHELKPHVPLGGKRFLIWKELKDQFQTYCLEHLNPVVEEEVA